MEALCSWLSAHTVYTQGDPHSRATPLPNGKWAGRNSGNRNGGNSRNSRNGGSGGSSKTVETADMMETTEIEPDISVKPALSHSHDRKQVLCHCDIQVVVVSIHSSSSRNSDASHLMLRVCRGPAQLAMQGEKERKGGLSYAWIGIDLTWRP